MPAIANPLQSANRRVCLERKSVNYLSFLVLPLRLLLIVNPVHPPQEQDDITEESDAGSSVRYEERKHLECARRAVDGADKDDDIEAQDITSYHTRCTDAEKALLIAQWLYIGPFVTSATEKLLGAAVWICAN